MIRLLLSLSLLLLCSCVKFPYSKIELPEKPQSHNNAEEVIWLLAGSLHSDFAVRTEWLTSNGCNLPASLKPYKYVCFGWGDTVAYTNRWGISDVPNALFWPSDSIVQVVGFNTDIIKTFPDDDIEKASVPAENGVKLANFLNQSFSYEPGTKKHVILRGAKWGHGYFIKSPYTYYLPRMCNQWVATALLEAGVHTTKPTAYCTSHSLLGDIQEYNNKEE